MDRLPIRTLGASKLDAGAWFDAAYAGTPIPTLEEGLVVLAQCGMGANVEIKPSKAAKRKRE